MFISSRFCLTLLSTADTMNNTLVKLEKELADLNELLRMLSGVGSRYGNLR